MCRKTPETAHFLLERVQTKPEVAVILGVSHEEVTEAANAAQSKMTLLMKELIGRI